MALSGRKKCIIEVDEHSQQVDLTPFVMSFLANVGVQPTVYLEDLAIKLIINNPALQG